MKKMKLENFTQNVLFNKPNNRGVFIKNRELKSLINYVFLQLRRWI